MNKRSKKSHHTTRFYNITNIVRKEDDEVVTKAVEVKAVKAAPKKETVPSEYDKLTPEQKDQYWAGAIFLVNMPLIGISLYEHGNVDFMLATALMGLFMWRKVREFLAKDAVARFLYWAFIFFLVLGGFGVITPLFAL